MSNPQPFSEKDSVNEGINKISQIILLPIICDIILFT